MNPVQTYTSLSTRKNVAKPFLSQIEFIFLKSFQDKMSNDIPEWNASIYDALATQRKLEGEQLHRSSAELAAKMVKQAFRHINENIYSTSYTHRLDEDEKTPFNIQIVVGILQAKGYQVVCNKYGDAREGYYWDIRFDFSKRPDK